MTTLVGLSGSLRHGSLNTALLRAAAELVPAGVNLDVRTIHGIPLYDGDAEEATGIPTPVSALKEAIAASDGLLLVTPEYNNSIPGPFKNALDWLTRPPADSKRVFFGRPVALAGASPGGFGTILSQNAWLPVMRTLGLDLWPGRLMVSKAHAVFDAEGKIADDGVREQVRAFIQGFADFAKARRIER
jgi:chromate reductase